MGQTIIDDGIIFCPGCMKKIEAGKRCPYCGYDSETEETSIHQLTPGLILDGKYYIGKVLGQGGFGITYLAYDLSLELKVAIKEYYPGGLASRVTQYSTEVMMPSGEQYQSYLIGKEKFIDEAKRLARYQSLPGVVSVYSYLETNNTAYIIMEYIDGVTLREYTKRHGGRIPTRELLDRMRPVLDSLAEIHQGLDDNKGIIHRDISPDNIMVDRKGNLKLLDFGAAREYIKNESGSMSVILRRGFAPFEQYSRDGKQGPWTDIYALCATMYYCLTGINPPESTDRIMDDTLLPPSENGSDLNASQEKALLKGMEIHSRNRYQSIEELKADLYRTGMDPVSSAQPAGLSKSNKSEEIYKEKTKINQVEQAFSQTDAKNTKPHKKKSAIAVACAVGVLVIGIAAGSFVLNQKNSPASQFQRAESYYYGDNNEQDFAKAVEWYEKAAEQDYSNAQFCLGKCYENGEGVEQDYEQAAKWYEKAAEQGHADAQYALGNCYGSGNGVEEDYAKAAEWYQKAAEQGHALAQNSLGDCYYFGNGVEENYPKSVEWYQKAAEQGRADAQFNLGYAYNYGTGTEQDFNLAFEWYEKAAEQGHAAAQNSVGDCYYFEIGVEADYQKAVEWYQKAAEQNQPDAQFNLGYAYYTGEGIEQDLKQAFLCFEKSANQGNASGQHSLGRCYYYGEGVEQDYAQAAEWYLKSAEQGNVDAQSTLGDCFYLGNGVEQDYVKAVEWYEKAAEQGHAYSMFCLGYCYERGLGVDADRQKADEWYAKAKENGYEF